MTTRRKKTSTKKAKDEDQAPASRPDESAAETEGEGAAPEQAAQAQPPEAAEAGEAPAAEFEELPESGEGNADPRNLSLVMEIPVTCSVELGRTRIRIADLLKLSRGSVIGVDRPAGDPLDLRVNGCLVARGEVVVVNDKFGIRLLDIVDRAERLKTVS